MRMRRMLAHVGIDVEHLCGHLREWLLVAAEFSEISQILIAYGGILGHQNNLCCESETRHENLQTESLQRNILVCCVHTDQSKEAQNSARLAVFCVTGHEESK